MDEDDFFQIGLISLLSYQGELNRPLAKQIIDRRIIDVLRNHGLFSRKEVLSHKETGKGIVREFIDIHELSIRDGKEDQLDLLIRQNALEQLRMCLNDREKLFLERYLKGHTLKQIGHILGVTESRACQLLKGIEQKGREAMAFKSEDSKKWKVFMQLASMNLEDKLSEETIAELTKVPLETVRIYTKEFRRIIPEHIAYTGNPPLYFFRDIGQSKEAIYGKVKDYYNKRARDRKKKKDPPEQTDFVRGRPPVKVETPEEATFPFAPVAGTAPPDNQHIVQQVAVQDLNQIKHLALSILNPIIAFRFDQVEMLHFVIREQQRCARAILEVLGDKPSNT